MTSPQQLGLPFGCWTLDRLEAYLNEEKGSPIKRSRIDELLIAEGLCWRTQETWFGERTTVEAPPDQQTAPALKKKERAVDPDFAQKRGHYEPLYGSSHGQCDGLPGSVTTDVLLFSLAHPRWEFRRHL